MKRRRFQSRFLACFLSLFALSATGAQLSIPTPAGFARVTPAMTKVSELIALSRVADTSSLAEFISERSVPKALQGDIPDLSRRHSVLLIEPELSQEDFVATRDYLTDRQDTLFAKAKGRHAKLLEDIAKGVSISANVRMQMSAGEVIPLPVHRSAQNIFSFSVFISQKARSESGKTYSAVVATTTTIIYVRGSMVSINTTGAQQDLEWTRDNSWRLAESILAANSR